MIGQEWDSVYRMLSIYPYGKSVLILVREVLHFYNVPIIKPLEKNICSILQPVSSRCHSGHSLWWLLNIHELLHLEFSRWTIHCKSALLISRTIPVLHLVQSTPSKGVLHSWASNIFRFANSELHSSHSYGDCNCAQLIWFTLW